MTTDDDDLFAAELEYLNAQHAELERQVAELEQDTGIRATLENSDDVVAAVIELIREWGNPVLAAMYQLAYLKLRQTERLCRACIARYLESGSGRGEEKATTRFCPPWLPGPVP